MSRENKQLCFGLLKAESEDAAIRLLKHYGYWYDDTLWHAYGQKENNWGPIGSQQGQPAGAMVEKLVNSIDAVLMRECLKSGMPTEGPDAPKSITEALETFFDIRNGDLANLSATQRTQLARNVGLVATGSKNKPNYTVFDRGEGQTPRKMPDTILSLSESNKLRIPFVQGEFNMGGSGALPFCGGEHNLQLVVSRRYPRIAERSDPTSHLWGVTVVRRQDPAQGESHSIYKYLAPQGAVLTFESDTLHLPHGYADASHMPRLEWGTVIKMFEYEMTGLKTSIHFRLFYAISLLLPRPGLPVRFYEFRNYNVHPEVTMSGLRVRLEDDKNMNLEDGFPDTMQMRVMAENMPIVIYAFRKGRDESYRRREGIIFTVNGQTHHAIDKRFFARHKVKMSYIANSILIVVDATRISPRAREKLFMTNRDHTRRGEFYMAIESTLEEVVRNNAKLKELRDRRRREALEDKTSDAKPLKDVLQRIVINSPSLAALFISGRDLGNPFKQKNVGRKEVFEGKFRPEYFRLMKRYRKPRINRRPVNRTRFRIQFETDVVDDYFDRETDPGEFVLQLNGAEASDYTLNLREGVATLNVSLPRNVEVGDRVAYVARVSDELLFAPFENEFEILVEEPDSGTGGNGKRKPPSGDNDGDREKPDTLTPPTVREVYQDEWDEFGYTKDTALDVKGTATDVYDFYINMDNQHYLWEMKDWLQQHKASELLKSRWQTSMVLVGMAILKEASNDQSSYFSENDLNPEELVGALTSMIAPVILPMIKTLGELEFETV